ncbi:hypothetical protein BN903_81 [Halorubrum sp. AJ67]|nr:hypothetical protein BN903_81 [Halorubrum sp. AJ67]
MISTLIRPEYPRLWIVLFLLGALIEWLVTATVYVEMSQIESNIGEAKSEIDSTKKRAKTIKSEIEETQSEVMETKSEVEGIQEDTFSFISDSQGMGGRSLEERVSNLEDEVGVGRGGGRGSLSRRVSDLEDRIDDIQRGF